MVICQVFKGPLGEVWADDPDNPRVAMVVIAGIHALAGSSGLETASELLELVPEGSVHGLLNPSDVTCPFGLVKVWVIY